MPTITPARVREIVALDDQPILRNLLVTDAYHHLTVDMAALLGGRDLAWPVFATWASRQAGTFIRREELPPKLVLALDELDPAHRSMVALILDAVARFIVGGNTIVFEELGHAFARFIELFRDPAARTQANLDALIAEFRPGECAPDRVEVTPDGRLQREQVGGQDLVRAAMQHFFEALHLPEGDARSELLLLANVECGLHEQIRLQPYIAGSLNAPLEQVLLLGGPVLARERVTERVLATVRRIATELMMTLESPHEVIDLGCDLKAPRDQPLWPSELGQLSNPTLLSLAARVGAYELREQNLDWGDRLEGWVLPLLARLALARDEAQGSAARDWARLDDRMRFIFEYFRSRQRDHSLLESPHPPAHQRAVDAARWPI